MPCGECHESALLLEDNSNERYGCASHLRVRCTQCGWVYTFYTSKKVNQFFDINRRLVYAMRAIGQGQSSARRFCALTNLPHPPNPKSYGDCNKALANAAKTVALSTMKEAGMELHNDVNDEVKPCSVSCDGTWQRRGYSSLNGCVTTISVDTGKCIDVEVLSKVCHGCKKIEKEKDERTKDVREAEHAGKCKANFQGSAPAMETEGVARIFARSEELHSLQYTEFFGDGDSKAYLGVENIYDNVHVEKKECVGHVQKRVGTALRKLKKENKVEAKVKPIYARLSSDDLLKKCLDGKTQNANESLNGMIWNRLPKTVFVGASVLSFGVYDAVAHFNIGTKAAENVLKELGMEPGRFFLAGMKKINKERIAKANFRNKKETRKRRKILRGSKKAKDDKLVEQEGSTYQPGAF